MQPLDSPRLHSKPPSRGRAEAEQALCGMNESPGKTGVQAQGGVSPGLGNHPGRGPGSLGSCSYFSFHKRQTDFFCRGQGTCCPWGHPEALTRGQRVCLETAHSLKCPDSVNGRHSPLHQTSHGEDLQRQGDGGVTLTQQGPLLSRDGVRGILPDTLSRGPPRTPACPHSLSLRPLTALR